MNTVLSIEQIEKLMWEYADETDTDNIIGLHCCDNFKDWLFKRIMSIYYE